MAYIHMLKQLWRYSGEERWKIVVYYVLHAISISGELGKPYAFAMIVNSLQANRPTVVNEISHWLGFYVACFFVFEIFHRCARYIEVPLAFRTRRRFVDAMYDKLQSLPLSWHTEHHSGNLIDRVNVAAHAVHEFGTAQMNYVAFLIKLWGPLIILWRISPQISIASSFVGCVMVAVTYKLYSYTVPLYRQTIETFHDFAAAFFDYMSNMKTIVTLRLGKHVKQDLDDRLARAFPFLMKEQHITQVKCAAIALLTLALEVGVIFYYVKNQNRLGATIMIGSVTAIFQYMGQLIDSFSFYAGDYERIIHWKADFEAAVPVMEAKCQVYYSSEAGLADWDRITVHPIRFSYDDEKLQLEDVSIRLNRGSKIAIVGESGSGKSTLLQVLRGLSSAPENRITVDGASLPLSVLSGTTTLVPQEPELFENTIRHNVTMGIQADDADIRTALQVACFDKVVEGLPKGLESDIREKGVNLSGGEKQRLALARGIFAIKDSSVVLADEPTSNIDPRTEMLIFERLFEFLSGRCIVSSIHRLHLLRLFDYVYVMKEGRIVEEGTFVDLCDQHGEFYRLWSSCQVDE